MEVEGSFITFLSAIACLPFPYSFLHIPSCSLHISPFSIPLLISPLPTACTHLLPLICQAEITSGFNTEFFRHLVTKHRLTAKLLRCVVMKLPDLQDAPPDWVPYNASCIDLKTILIATTDGVILKRLLKWGVRVNEEDIMAATQSLPDSQVRVTLIGKLLKLQHNVRQLIVGTRMG